MTSIKCRTCLTQESKTISLFAVGTICGEKLSLQDVLAKCADLQISREDGLPQQICTICVRQAEKAYSFRVMCEKSQSILLERTNRIASPNLEFGQVIKSEISDCDNQAESNEDDNDAYDETCDDSNTLEIVEQDDLDISDDNAEIDNLKLIEEFAEDIKTIRYVVNRQNLFRCQLCNSSYNSQFLLQMHNRYIHAKIPEKPKEKKEVKPRVSKRMECPICKKGYYSSSHMNLHMTGKRYHCDLCGRNFSQYRTFTSHIYSHTGERPFLCTECGKTFKQNVDLQNHMNIHLNLFKYECQVCGNKFRSHSSFTAHKRIHTGEKPFACPFCEKRFRISKNLLEHKRTHTGEKPHVCKMCGKGFAKLYSLSVHFRTHTGEKRHICTICGKGYSQAHCLRSHMKSFHANHDDTSQSDTNQEISNDVDAMDAIASIIDHDSNSL